MRSIRFDNIFRMREAKVKDWAIANRSSTTMVCCYTSAQHDYVLLQRGYRNYGTPNVPPLITQPQILSAMTALPRSIDYWIHFDRRCDCSCASCSERLPHSATNCQASCLNFDLEHMTRELMKPDNHQQCTCTCEFCSGGLVILTHRLIDCMPFCKRSSYARDSSL